MLKISEQAADRKLHLLLLVKQQSSDVMVWDPVNSSGCWEIHFCPFSFNYPAQIVKFNYNPEGEKIINALPAIKSIYYSWRHKVSAKIISIPGQASHIVKRRKHASRWLTQYQCPISVRRDRRTRPYIEKYAYLKYDILHIIVNCKTAGPTSSVSRRHKTLYSPFNNCRWRMEKWLSSDFTLSLFMLMEHGP